MVTVMGPVVLKPVADNAASNRLGRRRSLLITELLIACIGEKNQVPPRAAEIAADGVRSRLNQKPAAKR
jgi:hypothetical protein